MPKTIITELSCAYCGKRFQPTRKQRYRSKIGSKSYCCKTHRYGGTQEEHFWKHTKRLPNGCLEWTGHVGAEGYAVTRFNGRKHPAPHVAWFIHYREWPPKDMKTDHICHDPVVCNGGPDDPHRHCVEWSHLKLATNKENCSPQRAASETRRMKECRRGHPLTPENIYYRSDRPGSRQCRECIRIRYESFRRSRLGLEAA